MDCDEKRRIRAFEPEDDTRLVKVHFELEPSEWHGSATETLWAELEEDGSLRIRNTPFHVRDVSFYDIVEGTEASDGMYQFDRVRVRSGHSTYRIIWSEVLGFERFLKAWKPLEKIGCTFEQGYGTLVAVDVSPETDVYEAYAIMEKGETDGAWGFEEGHCGHPLRDTN